MKKNKFLAWLLLSCLFLMPVGLPVIVEADEVQDLTGDEPMNVEKKDGVDPACILKFLQEIKDAGVENHGMVIMRHGQVLFESYVYPYAAEIPHMMFSLTKSIVSTAVGFAIDEGKLALDTKITDLFAEYEYKDDPKWEDVTIESLLTMQSGKKYSFVRDMSRGDYAEIFMKAPFRKDDGFFYSNDDAYMLAAAVTKVAGEPLVDYLMPRLFEPLGIERPFWETDVRGICIGGNGIYLKTMDVARICNCYLNRGQYEGKQVIPEVWALTAGRLKVKTEEDLGYGYLFWVNDDDSYRMAGMLGQFGIIFPQHDAVVAITGCTLEEEIQNEIFDKYFPLAFESTAEKGSWESLNNFLEERNRMDIPRSARNPLEKDIDGKVYNMNKPAKIFTGLINAPYSIMPLAINVSFAQRPHESMDDLCFQFEEDACIITWQEEESRIQIRSGMGGEPYFSDIERCGYPYQLWSYCYWQDNKLNVVVKPINTPGTQRFEFAFRKNKMTMKMKSNPDFAEFISGNAVSSGEIPDIKFIAPAVVWIIKQVLDYDKLPVSFNMT